jgi:antirestriction protein ArdC
MSMGQTNTNPEALKRDHRQEVTESIIKMLEEGVAPWQKPWQGTAMPYNPTTERPYRGGNAIQLMAAELARGYLDPRWMTYKQAAQNGWQVRHGERGTHIEFWEVRQRQEQDNTERNGRAESSDPKEGRRLVHRVYTVFNATQVDGIPPYERRERAQFEAAESGERILVNSGARIEHDQRDRAFYNRAADSIHLPPKEAFDDAPGYYGTALHELAHWTGHPSRMNRVTLTESYRFGDLNYAREELRAELASVFLAAELGVPHDPANHAAYVGSWIEALRKDKNEIFRAAHDASQAVDFVLALEQNLSHSQALEVVLSGRDQVGRADRAGDDTTIQRENSRLVARNELGTGTIEVHDKQSTTDRHMTVEVDGSRREELAASYSAAKGVTAKALGENARTYTAQTQSGTYIGKIIGETKHHVIQRLSGRSAVAHIKELLDPKPRPGDNISIVYQNGQAALHDIRVRTREREIAR